MQLAARPIFFRLVQTAVLAAAASGSPAVLRSAEAAAAGDRPAPEFVIFVGPEISVSDRGIESPVVSADERDLAILRRGERVSIPTRDAQFKITMEPKLSRHELSVEHLTGERVHDPRTDPGRDALQQQLVMDSIQTQSEELAAVGARETADNAAAIARAAEDPNSGVTVQDVVEATAEASQAASKLSQAYSSPKFQSWSPKMSATDENADFDAFEVTFRLSAPVEIADAYGLLRMIVRDSAHPQQGVSVLKFFPLRVSAARERKIVVLQTGLPAGFKVDSYSVHFFSGHRELASNVSPSRLGVSADEAHQFLVLRHLQLNPKASLPAEFIPDLSAVDAFERLNAGKNAIVDLAIDREGRVTRLKSVRNDDEIETAALETQLRQLRFLPALLNGTPVDSEGTFAISEFAR